MLKVGLTGGIACGKSVVAGMLQRLGAHVIRADEVAHQLMEPGGPVYIEIVNRFGPEILDHDYTINRAKLAAVAFAPENPRITELNRIIHPAVIEHQDRWTEEVRRRYPQGIAVVEAALILEAGVRDHFDRMVVVTCPPEQKIERMAKRHNLDLAAARTEVERRSSAQLPDDEKISQADFVIDNSGALEETERQVADLFAKLKQEAEQKN